MIKLGIVMDPISSININKDSNFAILLEAQRREYEIHYMEISSMYLYGSKAKASSRLIKVKHDYTSWYSFISEQDINLSNLDVILMRKDPPFNIEFIYATYILERAESEGVLIVNKPQSLRDCNEKMFITWFANQAVDTLVSRREKHIRDFWHKHGDIILKPLDGMGGKSIFRIKKDDPNITVIIETMTDHGSRFCMAQKYLPAIKNGDKRILIVDGEPVPYCLARIPKNGETRSNLIAGGHGEARPLSENDWKIANSMSSALKKRGLIFVGIDIIGDYLTEINVTSPTCIQEIEAAFPISITSMFMNTIEKYLML